MTTSRAPLIWITRAQPAADETAERVRALGLEALVDPVLQVRALGGRIGFGGMGAIAFTSRNGVDAFAASNPERDLPVFAVGDATAEAARRAGFAHVRSADGDVEALARLIGAEHDRASGAVLAITAREPAGDLSAALAGVGVNVAAIQAYGTLTQTAEAARAQLGQIRAILIHSPRAALALAEQLTRSQAAGLSVIAISANAAAPLGEAGFAEVRIAARPTEAAMLDELDRMIGPRRAPPAKPEAAPSQKLDAPAAPAPDPDDDDDAPIRVITPAFIIALTFGLACVLAALVIAFILPRMASARDPAKPASSAAPSHSAARPHARGLGNP